MSYARRTRRSGRDAGQKDGNHAAFVILLEQLGCSVVELHNAGVPGLPDLVVGCIGATHLVEVKNPDTRYGRAGLSSTQSAFARDWRGSPVWPVSTADDVIDLVRLWRRGRPSNLIVTDTPTQRTP